MAATVRHDRGHGQRLTVDRFAPIVGRMTREQARQAKQQGVPVHVPVGMGDADYGVIIQVGGHDSGNDDLVAIQRVHDVVWHHFSQVRHG
jgi:hypothetical protein